MIIETKFNVRDKVIINNDTSVVAVVQRFQTNGTSVLTEVMWFGTSGDVKEHWFYEWQLELAS